MNKMGKWYNTERIEKRCPTCGITYYGNLKICFFRSSSNCDGLDWQCKKCQKIKDNVMARRFMDRKRQRKDANKYRARHIANKTYSAKDHLCSVLSCIDDAVALHHVDYEKPLDVVPLCTTHHEDLHH